MDELYNLLINDVKTYIHNADTLKTIEEAYLFARTAHNGQKRASGEEYIVHPVNVARTLCLYKADPTTLISALLHDVIEDTDYTYDDILNKFGKDVADLVEGLTKITKIKYSSEEILVYKQETEYASNFQKMLIQMSKDIRVIWVKLSDRLNNMRTLEFLPFEKQIRISKETLAIYAPIAHKLGISKIKSELEDLSFKYLYPQEYKEISKKLDQSKTNRENNIIKMKKMLSELLESENIKPELSGRVKNVYSIYNKMKNKNLAFENIYDIQALRIIVDTVMDCYKVIGLVHSKFTPVPSRFKDYIAMPKPNMYQSLHTTVVYNGKIYEIQVRTHEMDEIAEYGIAAHWAYKEGMNQKKDYYENSAKELRWYSDLLKFTKENKDETEDLFTEDVLNANVYVFTPKNTVVALPEGSTPLDFAYRIHSRIGDQYTGAIVNGKIVPIDYQFKTGDICEIKTSASSYGPNDNWLKIAKTTSARNKIKQFLNKKNRDLLIEEGKEQINKIIKDNKLDLVLTDELVSKMSSPERQLHSLDDLYYVCGKGVYSASALLNDFITIDQSNNERIIEIINQRNKNKVYHEDINIIVDGIDSPSVKLAHCCSPIPGDDIVGYVTKGVGIAIHRRDCSNIKDFDPNRFIDVHWADDSNLRFQVDLKLFSKNRDNILADVLNCCVSCNSKVTRVSAKSTDIDDAIINLTVQVLNKADLSIMISNLEKIKGIYQIERVKR